MPAALTQASSAIVSPESGAAPGRTVGRGLHRGLQHFTAILLSIWTALC